MALRRLTACAALPVLLAATGCASRVEGPAPDLRLRRVVLYQNGLGYFERTGALPGGRLRMRFRDRELNDVLESIVVVEEGLDPARDKPSTVSVRLADEHPKGDDDAVSSVDLQLSRAAPRGVSIAYEVPTAAWKATYRVLLPDASAAAPEKRALVQAWALVDNVSDEDWDGVRLSLATGAPLSFATDLRTPSFIERPSVSTAPPSTVTGAVRSEHAQGHESINGDRDGDGIVDSKDACPNEPGAPSGQADHDGCPQFVRVEGNEVRVLQSVVFARDSDALPAEATPILDEMARMLKGNPRITALTIEGHTSGDEKDGWAMGARRAGAVRAGLAARGVTTKLTVQSFGSTRPIADDTTAEGRQRNRRVQFHIEEERDGERRGDVQAAAVQRSGGAGAAPTEMAGAVRYDVSDPVTIPRHSSSLVTIVNRFVPGEEVLLFRPDAAVPDSARHPFRAARLENPGDMALQPGTVAIFAGGSFVGEGLLARLDPGDTTLIPYALDGATDVRVTTEESEKPLRIVAMARGVLTVEDADTLTTRYEISAGKQASARIVLRHGRHEGYEAKSLPPRTESSPDAYLLPLPLRGGEHSVLSLDELRQKQRDISVTDTAAATLTLYLQGSSLPPDLEKRVREVIALRSEIGALDDEVAALRGRVSDVGARAGELRESLRAVERTPKAAGLQRQLVAQLADATKQIDDVSAQLAAKTGAESLAKTRLSESLRDLRLGEPGKK
jgi:outer membrane protein OmpA-like peptidoglycan-associated protein